MEKNGLSLKAWCILMGICLILLYLIAHTASCTDQQHAVSTNTQSEFADAGFSIPNRDDRTVEILYNYEDNHHNRIQLIRTTDPAPHITLITSTPYRGHLTQEMAGTKEFRQALDVAGGILGTMYIKKLRRYKKKHTQSELLHIHVVYSIY